MIHIRWEKIFSAPNTQVYLLWLYQPIFFLRIDDSHCDRIHSSLTAVHYFDNCCGKAASGLEKILCRVLVKRTSEKHG